MRRKTPLLTSHIYHVYTKSIYKYVIFPTEKEYMRMLQTLKYHLTDKKSMKLCDFLKSYTVRTSGFRLLPPREGEGLVEIRAYCLMPTHIHLILKQVKEDGIRTYMHRVLGSYSQYFNKLHNRKGPLWQERFGASLIRSDAELTEKTAYVHTNPVKDRICRNPEEWPYSSLPGREEVMGMFRRSGDRS